MRKVRFQLPKFWIKVLIDTNSTSFILLARKRLAGVFRLLCEPLISEQLVDGWSIAGIEFHDLADKLVICRGGLPLGDEVKGLFGRALMVGEVGDGDGGAVMEVVVRLGKWTKKLVHSFEHGEFVFIVVGFEAFDGRVEEVVMTTV